MGPLTRPARDPRVRAWALLDELVREIYRTTGRFPAEEREGLARTLRRTAVASAARLAAGDRGEGRAVDGCLDETVLRYLVVINEGLSVHRSDQPDSSDGLDDVDDGDVDMDDRREPDVVADVPAPSIDAAPESEPTAEEGGE